MVGEAWWWWWNKNRPRSSRSQQNTKSIIRFRFGVIKSVEERIWGFLSSLTEFFVAIYFSGCLFSYLPIALAKSHIELQAALTSFALLLLFYKRFSELGRLKRHKRISEFVPQLSFTACQFQRSIRRKDFFLFGFGKHEGEGGGGGGG